MANTSQTQRHSSECGKHHMSSFSFPPSAKVKRLCFCGTSFVVLSANGRDATGNPCCPAVSKILKVVFRRKVKAQYSLMILGAE